MLHDVDSVLVMMAELQVRPGRMQEFLAYTVPNLDVSRGHAGNISFDILLDESRPETVIFYEVWQSAEAQQAYMAWRIQQGDLTTLMAFLTGQPRFTALRRVAA